MNKSGLMQEKWAVGRVRDSGQWKGQVRGSGKGKGQGQGWEQVSKSRSPGDYILLQCEDSRSRSYPMEHLLWSAGKSAGNTA